MRVSRIFWVGGRLEEAQELIASMHVEPDGAVWGALLGACKTMEM